MGAAPMNDDYEPALPSQAALARDRIFQLRLQIEKARREHPTDVPALMRLLSGETNRLRRVSKANFSARYGQ
jgi:hypothetical protein